MIDGTEELVDTGENIAVDMAKEGTIVEPHKCACVPKSTDIEVNFKKLHEDAVLPAYAKPGDAGMDCYAVSDPIIAESYVAYNLGFAVEIPKGYVGLLFPRSSVSKKDLVMANSVGVIDSGYRGEVQARFKPTYWSPVTQSIHATMDGSYKNGDAVCQLVILPHPQVKAKWADELSETVRGEGGFGHTDK